MEGISKKASKHSTPESDSAFFLYCIRTITCLSFGWSTRSGGKEGYKEPISFLSEIPMFFLRHLLS